MGWLPALATATSIAAVHTTLKQVCFEIRGNDEYHLIWNDTATINVTLDSAFTPDQALQEQLASGSSVTHTDPTGKEWTLLPLLHGWLRGWLALPHPHADDPLLLPIALQAAARLVTFGSDLRAAAQLQELHAFDPDLHATDPLLNELYEAVQRTLGAQHMFLALYDSASGLLRFAANFVYGRRGADTEQWTVAQGLTGEVIRRNTTLVTDNYVEACKEAGITPMFMADAPPVYAWLGVPLCHGDRILGVLTIYSDDPTVTYSAEYVRTLEMFAEWAASSLERMRLSERAIQQTRQLELLNELGRTVTSTLDLEAVPSLIMGRVQQIMDVEEGSLLLLDEDTNELIFSYSLSPYGRQLLGMRLPLSVGLAGLVVRTGQSLIANRAHRHPAFYAEIDEVTGHQTRDMLCVPLIGRYGVQGVIEIINRRDGTPFTVRDRTLLEAVADQAVIAIENANLYARTDRTLARRVQELDERNKQLHEILQVGNLIKAASDLRAMLPQLLQAICGSIRFQRASIFLLEAVSGRRPVLQQVAYSGLDSDPINAGMIDPERIESLLRQGTQRSPSIYYLDQGVNGDNPLRTHSPAPIDMPQPRIGAWHPDDMLVAVLRSSSGELLGLLTVDDPLDGLLPTGDQIQTLEIFTNQLVVALENSRLYDQLRQSLQGVTALSALGMAINTQDYTPQSIWQLTVGGIVDASGAVGAGVLLIGDATQQPEILKLGRDHTPDDQLLELAGQVARRGRPLQIHDNAATFPASIASAGGRAVLMLPLAGSHTTLGTLYVWYPDLLPSLEDQDLVALFANQAAVAVENKLLAAAVREGRDRLASILSSTEEAIMLLSADLMVIEVNAAAQSLFDMLQADAWLHQPVVTLIPEWGARSAVTSDAWDSLFSALDSVQSGAESEARGQFKSAGVRPRWYEWTVLPVLSQQAAAPYPLILVLRDITAAMEIENLRQELTYMIVHDLRGPISSVLTSLDMLSKQMMGAITEGQDKVLRIAMRSCSRLLDMVNMLLDINKLEAGQMPLNQAPTQIEDLLRPVLQTYEGLLAERRVHAKIEIAPNLPAVWIDPATIDRVIQNLVDNAIKYSPSGSAIEIGMHVAHPDELVAEHPNPHGAWMLVKVRDAGPGIPAHLRERVFEKFAQVQKSGVKGTGLGLTYCRLAVEAHGGRIWVGETEGPGSTFLFTVPLERLDTSVGSLPAPAERVA